MRFAVASILSAGVAVAADAPAPDSAELGEVVVTANKLNATKVLDTPVSIQAISGDALQRTGASGIMDIAGDIPGLSIQDLGPGDKKYVIRGINSPAPSTTGVYYGEAVISGSNADDGGGFEADIRLYDLDRVEVLRGPQGTLYGASSMSGTIRFMPKLPDHARSSNGYVTVEGSRHRACAAGKLQLQRRRSICRIIEGMSGPAYGRLEGSTTADTSIRSVSAAASGCTDSSAPLARGVNER